MKLTVWGARGSIPVSGTEYVRYGGDTTCVELETGAGETIILDAGSGLRALGKKLQGEGKKKFHLLMSHAHWDHLIGFPFFRPLYSKETTIHIHGCTNAQKSLRAFLEVAMSPPYFPVSLSDVPATLDFDDGCPAEMEFGGIRCETILLNHPNYGYGHRIWEGNRSIAFFPDNELDYAHPKGGTFDDYAGFVEGVDLLIHDAEYLPDEYESWSKGWGHSVLTDTIRLASEAKAGHLLLWHLNQDRSDDELDEMLAQARQLVADTSPGLTVDMARTGLELSV
jgi:phosphoribosyl 1,2-cyclic phosphodiesterase